jgi:hypothetical protein
VRKTVRNKIELDDIWKRIENLPLTATTDLSNRLNRKLVLYFAKPKMGLIYFQHSQLPKQLALHFKN